MSRSHFILKRPPNNIAVCRHFTQNGTDSFLGIKVTAGIRKMQNCLLQELTLYIILYICSGILLFFYCFCFLILFPNQRLGERLSLSCSTMYAHISTLHCAVRFSVKFEQRKVISLLQTVASTLQLRECAPTMIIMSSLFVNTRCVMFYFCTLGLFIYY